jgi:hypothetical protein
MEAGDQMKNEVELIYNKRKIEWNTEMGSETRVHGRV